MALTYTALGLVVAAAGLQFERPCSTHMSGRPVGGVYTAGALHVRPVLLQLPSSLQTRLTLLSNKRRGGSPGGSLRWALLPG